MMVCPVIGKVVNFCTGKPGNIKFTAFKFENCTFCDVLRQTNLQKKTLSDNFTIFRAFGQKLGKITWRIFQGNAL